jgi:flagellar basal-body rod protein FlgG
VNWRKGSLSQTGGDLDIAIEGRGYLEVTLPSGVRPIPATAACNARPTG